MYQHTDIQTPDVRSERERERETKQPDA